MGLLLWIPCLKWNSVLNISDNDVSKALMCFKVYHKLNLTNMFYLPKEHDGWLHNVVFVANVILWCANGVQEVGHSGAVIEKWFPAEYKMVFSKI